MMSPLALKYVKSLILIYFGCIFGRYFVFGPVAHLLGYYDDQKALRMADALARPRRRLEQRVLPDERIEPTDHHG